ncbi:hypothetical protein [Devosia sediminis]|uniref:Uncharacterized protein n=1 Tax=Devosia sediminis TaxID=2798801 RepID=A0A934IX07_9HYPH|nr:hypothetical protein [Devosia sediminis]MBJ3783852.1 hypothetical protein [Devosia sediminis]
MSKTEIRMERADTRFRRPGSERRIKVPGMTEYYGNDDPTAIAKALRAKSELGALERKLAAN